MKNLITKQKIAFFALFLAAYLLPFSVSFAAEGESEFFNYYSMEFKGARHGRIVADFNQDGLLDFGVVFSRSDQRDKYWFRSCVFEKQKGFTANNCSNIGFPKGARAFDIGEIDGKPGIDFIIITDSGLLKSSFSGKEFGKFLKLSDTTTILDGTGQDLPVPLKFLWDIDKDKKLELVLPTIKGPEIHKYDGTSLVLLQRINSPAHITYRVGSLGDIMATDDLNQFLLFKKYAKRTSANYTAPDVFVDDFNGDGKTDIFTLVDNTLKVFPQGANGRFPDKPVVDLQKSILPPEEKGVGFAGEAMTFADLNNDGLWDLIMMKWGSSEERTQMDRYIYYAKPGLEYNEDPDQIIRSENAAVDFGIFDLNNNDRLDLVIPFFHFAPAQAFKIMTENSIKVQFRLFLMGENGRYNQDPGKTFAKVDRRLLINYKIDLIGMIFNFQTLLEGKFHPLISFGSDFNGDGYNDLVADSGGDRLCFYWGNKDVQFARAPDHKIDFESAQDFDLADFNGDGKMDVITFYDSEERTAKKRELAKKSRQQGETVSEISEEAALVTSAEGTRVKVLISR